MKRPYLKDIKQIKSDIRSNELALSVAEDRVKTAKNEPSKTHFQERIRDCMVAIKFHKREMELTKYILFLETERKVENG
jgi:hypothetical protein